MTLKEFTKKYEDVLNSTYAGLYYFMKKHQAELEKIGAIEIIQKLEREYAIVKDEEKLLGFIKERQTNKKLRSTKNLEVVEV